MHGQNRTGQTTASMYRYEKCRCQNLHRDDRVGNVIMNHDRPAPY